MKKLGFITSSEDPNLIGDDHLVFAPLKDLGYSVSPVIWDKSDENLGPYDAFVFRSCWNYHVKFEEFLKWLEILKAQKKPVLNPLSISTWNLNKRYLLELRSKGAAVPQTEWFAKGSSFDAGDVKSKIGLFRSDQVVIRPAISLSGHDTYLVSTAEKEKLKKVWQSMPVDRDILVQEYIPEIRTAGETSLIFFNGEFSHAIRKTPAANEFRIHSEYGGSRTPVVPGDKVIAAAKEILKLAGESLVFARVDVIERPQGAILIELEIIDPMLFLGFSEGAPKRFARAIAERLSRVS